MDDTSRITNLPFPPACVVLRVHGGETGGQGGGLAGHTGNTVYNTSRGIQVTQCTNPVETGHTGNTVYNTSRGIQVTQCTKPVEAGHTGNRVQYQ